MTNLCASILVCVLEFSLAAGVASRREALNRLTSIGARLIDYFPPSRLIDEKYASRLLIVRFTFGRARD
jgi:hypothetical protein